MKKLTSFLASAFSSTAGFTMIELLIVITILGILAVAVLSAINPVEQINRGRDTGSRSDAEQLVSAIDRFYAFQGYYPWQVSADPSANGGNNPTGIAFAQWDGTLTDIVGTCTLTEKLSTSPTGSGCTGTDELKVTYFDRIEDAGYNSLYIFNEGDQGDSTYVCFEPKSKAFLTEAAARCGDADGTSLPEDLQAIGPDLCVAGSEYICLP